MTFSLTVLSSRTPEIEALEGRPLPFRSLVLGRSIFYYYYCYHYYSGSTFRCEDCEGRTRVDPGTSLRDTGNFSMVGNPTTVPEDEGKEEETVDVRGNRVLERGIGNLYS